MLTREEAKTKECPIKMGNPKLLRSEYKCKAEDCPKWRNEYDNKMLWCSKIEFTDPTFIEEDGSADANHTGAYFTHECIEEYEGIWTFSSEKDNEGNLIVDKYCVASREAFMYCYLKSCNKCPHRYGYCGS